MSKAKPKDKKQDNHSQLQKQFQLQKRELIDYHFTVKKLEEKLSSKVTENEELKKQLEQTRQLYEEKIRIMDQKIDDAQKNNELNIEKITTLELSGTRHEATINAMKEELSKQKHDRIKEVESIRIRMDAEKSKLLIQLKQWQGFSEVREANQIEINELRQKLQTEKADRIRQVADKQRQKVQAIDKLRDDMAKQTKEMHNKYSSLKQEQLDTTTRLTILQNHQLTSELEYQSKQTQKLIFKQEDLHQKVKQLTQQLAIHKQVEEQLAKRAHFSKGVIKKLSDRVAELEELNNEDEDGKSQKKIISKLNTSYNIAQNQKNTFNQEGASKQIISELEKQLAITENKYTETHTKMEAIIKERENISRKMKKFENSVNSLVRVMIKFSEQLFDEENIGEQKTQIINPVIKLDLQKLRIKEVEAWSDEEIKTIIHLLLYLIKPYMTQKNFSIPAIKKFLAFQEKIQTENSERKLPKLMNEQQSGIRALKDLPVNISTKIVGSNLRQWGQTIKQNRSLRKQYKVSTQSNR